MIAIRPGRRASWRERADRRTDMLRGAALANYENALQAARSLWMASDGVDRSAFNAFARSLDLPTRYPGLQGIGWRQVVTDDQAAGSWPGTGRTANPASPSGRPDVGRCTT